MTPDHLPGCEVREKGTQVASGLWVKPVFVTCTCGLGVTPNWPSSRTAKPVARKPRLTKRVMDGLVGLASYFEAGGPADFTGYEEEKMSPEQKQRYDDACLAAEWITAMARHRERVNSHRGARATTAPGPDQAKPRNGKGRAGTKRE